MVKNPRGHGQPATVEAKAAADSLPKNLLSTLSTFASGRGLYVVLGVDEVHGFAPAPGFDTPQTTRLLDGAATQELSPPLRLDIFVEEVEGAQVVMA